jgi:hypothetical protein
MSTATIITLARLSTGPTERSRPPTMIEGAVAIATIANGARLASVSGSDFDDTKLGWTTRFAANSATAKTAANMNVCPRMARATRAVVDASGIEVPPSSEEARHQRLP